MQATVAGIAVETSDLRTEDQRQGAAAVLQVPQAMKSRLLPGALPDELDLLAKTLNLTWEACLDQVLVRAYNQERNPNTRTVMAARITAYCLRHDLEVPGSVEGDVHKRARTEQINKLVFGDNVVKKGLEYPLMRARSGRRG